MSLASRDIASMEITDSLLSANDKGRGQLIQNVEQQLVQQSVKFHDVLKRQSIKTFASMYKTTIPGQNNAVKTIKADRRLMQRLLTAVSAGQPVELESILQHELTSIPLSFAKAGGEMNSISKSELIGILADGFNLLPDFPESEIRTCALIGGHALIQKLVNVQTAKLLEIMLESSWDM